MKAVLQAVAVLGATGMLGQALCREGGRRGYRIAGIARSGTEFNIDATDIGRLQSILYSIAPSAVINAAALTSLDECERDPGAAYAINARLVATLASYCSERSLKLVQVSTDHYFTGDGPGLHNEDAPVRLVNEYARTKYAGEAFARICPQSLTIRTNLVGFRRWVGRPTFVEWALAALRSSQPVTLFDDFYTSSLDVGTFAVALFDLLASDATGVLNVASRVPTSKKDFVLGLAGRLGLNTQQCRTGSVTSLGRVPRAESLGLDVGRAEALLGYTLPGTTEVLNQLAREYEESLLEL